MEPDPYPDGLNADLTAVRPINLWDSILGVRMFDQRCNKKAK